MRLISHPLIRKLLPFLVLVLGIVMAMSVMKSRPRPNFKPPIIKPPEVEVSKLTVATHYPSWSAGGNVRAAEKIQLNAEVSGLVTQINPAATPGAFLNKHDKLLSIKAEKYRYTLQQRQAALTQAESELALEYGRQQLAEEEFSLADQTLSEADKALVLRQPQIIAAKAEVAKAKALLQQAELDIKNTQITMPFQGQIIDRYVGASSSINTNTPLFDIINTESFWVEVKIPRAFVQWLDLKGEAIIRNPNAWGNKQRTARILNMRPDVDSNDRQAKVLLEVNDPLALKQSQPRLLVNDFVEVSLPGIAIPNSIAIPIKALVNQDQIWVVTTQNTLLKKQLNIAFRGRNHVIADQALTDGEQLLTSRLANASQGLQVTPLMPDVQDAQAAEGAQDEP